METLWILIAFGLGLISRQLGLPPLIGFLATGFVLSAYGVEAGGQIAEIAHYGVLLLLFTVGLKLRWQSVVRPEVLGGGLIAFLLWTMPFAGLLVVLGGFSLEGALLIAAALGFSSTVVAAKVLEQKRELRAFHGRVSIGILIVQDLIAVAALSLTGTGHALSWMALGVLALPLAIPLLKRLLDHSGHDELFVLYGMVLALVAGGLAFEHVGLSSELGALVLGALLANHPRAIELSKTLWGVKELFLVAFFLEIGLSGIPSLEGFGLALLLTLFLPLKAALFFHVLGAFKLRARTAFLVAISLATYSEFALIVAHSAVTSGLLGQDSLVVLAVAVAISFALSAPLNRYAHTLYGWREAWLTRFERAERHPDEQPVSVGHADFVIMGMGRVGTGAYELLTKRGAAVVGLDSDPGQVERHTREERRVLYADAEDPSLWAHLDLGGVRAVLLAMLDSEAMRAAAHQLRQAKFEGLIVATSIFADQGKAIVAAGADVTFDYYDQVGVGFAELAWEELERREGSQPTSSHPRTGEFESVEEP